MIQKYLAFIALSALLFQARAQEGRSGLQLTSIEERFELSPECSQGGTSQLRGISANWLIADAEFVRKPKGRAASADRVDLTFDCSIAPNNCAAGLPRETLLDGGVTYSAIPVGGAPHSGAFIARCTLRRDCATERTRRGCSRRHYHHTPRRNSGEERLRHRWSNGFQPTYGFVLNKDETPFLPLYRDFCESIRLKTL